MTGRNRAQHAASLELRKGSRTSPVDALHVSRTTREREALDLEDYLPSVAGRCLECGHHPSMQGHRPTCPVRG